MTQPSEEYSYPFKVGEEVRYTKDNMNKIVTVIDAHLMDGEPFYTIKGDFGDGQIKEKQTVSDYLQDLVDITEESSPVIESEMKCESNEDLTFAESVASASMMKKDGDTNVKERKFDMAIMNYSIAIDAIVEVSSLERMLSNRSYANLMKGDSTSALRDAECCITLAPNWAKGYYRKASAQMKLKKNAEGIQTLKDAMAKFPDDKQLKDVFVQAVKDMQDTESPNTMSSSSCNILSPRFRTSGKANSKGKPQIVKKQGDTEVIDTFCSWLLTQPKRETLTTNMNQFYNWHPEMRGRIGKLSAFCRNNSDRLKIEDRNKRQYVVLLN